MKLEKGEKIEKWKKWEIEPKDTIVDCDYNKELFRQGLKGVVYFSGIYEEIGNPKNKRFYTTFYLDVEKMVLYESKYVPFF